MVRTCIRSYGLYKRPDTPNTLTCQSTAMNDAPRDPCLNGTLYGILPVHRPNVCYLYIYNPFTSDVFVIAVIIISTSIYCSWTHNLSNTNAVLVIRHFRADPHSCSYFDSVFDRIRLIFSGLIQLLFHKK